jgi:predicted dehydrogenase
MRVIDFPSGGLSVRVGLLGAGGIATAHAQALATIPGVELCGIADVERARADRLAGRFGTDGYGSLEELLGAKPDAIHVLLPPAMHARFAIEAMAAGMHVLVEKPLCVSETECRELQAAAERHGRLVAVNHNVSFEPAFQRLLEAVRRRKLGAVQHVAMFWSVPFGGRAADVLESGPHPLSLVVRLLGEVRSARVGMSSLHGGTTDTWQIGLRCERGTAQLFLGFARSYTDTRLHVLGEDASATCDLRLGTLSVVENTRSTPLWSKLWDTLGQARDLGLDAVRAFADRMARLPSGGACDDGGPVFRASLASFYSALRTGSLPPASLREGLAVVRSCLRVIAASPTVETPEADPWVPATASS